MPETHATPGCVWVPALGTKGGGLCPRDIWGPRSEAKVFLVAQTVKNPPAMQELQETWVPSLCWGDPLEEGMATHSSTLAWRIPWVEESDGLQTRGSQRDRHDGNDSVCTHASETSEKPMVRNLEVLTKSCLILSAFRNHRPNCSSCPRSCLLTNPSILGLLAGIQLQMVQLFVTHKGSLGNKSQQQEFKG